MEHNEDIVENDAPMEKEEQPKKPKEKFQWKKFLLLSLSYILVISVTVMATLTLWGPEYSKLTELEMVIDQMFVGEYDKDELQDAAARAMITATGDRWSFYMSAEELAEYQTELSNSFVGIGVTVVANAEGLGEDITAVTEGGPAQEAGIQVGDIIIKVDGTSIAGLSSTEARDRIVGEENTQVILTILRGEQELDFTVTRRTIQVPVATGTLLENNVGLVRIENFNTNCAQETIAAIETLKSQGATALVFDVRFNPGGYVDEMVKLLDYLLPECVVFREMDYLGNESAEYSDAACLEMPFAVLVNGDSYSAAEFFAACLREYDKAIVVGEQTCGKGYYQQTILLSDGSAVNLSTGKYFTPNGVNLTEQGGLVPDVPLTVDEETAVDIYLGTIEPEEDPQLQAAVAALLNTNV